MNIRFLLLFLCLFQGRLFADSIHRVVSLAPSLTEMVYALGVEDKLVGVTRYCNYPPEVSNKIRVGGILDPDEETLIRLKPDLILLSYSGNTREQAEKLQKLGFRTESFKESRVEDVLTNLLRLAEILECSPDSATNIFLSKYRSVQPLEAGASAVVLLSWKPAYSVSTQTFIGDVLKKAGLSNVVHSSISYPQLSFEDLLRLHAKFWILPDSMKKQQKEIQKTLKKFGLKPIWIFVNQDLISRPGPRIPDAILELTREVKKALRQS